MANPVCAVHTTLYDAAGNVTADNANNYLYDGEGRICAVQDRTFGGMTQYIYDAEGTRVAKGVNTNLNAGCDTSGPTFTLTNTYVIGPSGEQLTETDGQGNWVHTNVFAAGQLLATYSYTDNSHAATDTYFALSDWLGTKRAVVSAGGCGTGYVGLPYGGDLTATNLPGFTQCPDVTEHHFTGKERDAESGNDYFGARYFGSSMGRWLSPDDFTKDTHVADPQSWNLYAYARNNPLRYIDPTGQNATVSTSCSTDSSGHQTCNVNISASIAIYAAQGSGISKDQMNAAAATMKSSIEGAWSGSFSQNGISYNVSTQVSVSVASNQDAAMSSGAQNVVGMTNGPIAMADGQLAGAYVNPKSSPGQTDTGLMDVHNVDNYAKHEFTHMLGVNDKPGDVLSNTDPQQRPNAATNSDFRWGVQEAVGLQQGSRDHFMNPLLSNSLLQKVIVGAPAPGQWWK
jgi:RHS repeat-associated protein